VPADAERGVDNCLAGTRVESANVIQGRLHGFDGTADCLGYLFVLFVLQSAQMLVDFPALAEDFLDQRLGQNDLFVAFVRDGVDQVWVHGGGFSAGDKSGGPSADLAQKFAKLGYVTVSINYRLIQTGCTGSNLTGACAGAAIDAQHDAQAAVRFLRANATTFGIDPTRIGIGGDSAGAITATLVGLHSEDPGDSGNPGPSSQVGGFASLSGGLPNGLFAGPGDAPGILFSGTADPIVPFQWSVDTAAAMTKALVPAFLEVFDGAGHDPYTAPFAQQIYEQSDYFFYFFLDLAHAAGQPASVRASADRQELAFAKR